MLSQAGTRSLGLETLSSSSPPPPHALRVSHVPDIRQGTFICLSFASPNHPGKLIVQELVPHCADGVPAHEPGTALKPVFLTPLFTACLHGADLTLYRLDFMAFAFAEAIQLCCWILVTTGFGCPGTTQAAVSCV